MKLTSSELCGDVGRRWGCSGHFTALTGVDAGKGSLGWAAVYLTHISALEGAIWEGHSRLDSSLGT